MLAAASEFFALITDGQYSRLLTDDSTDTPILRAQRPDETEIGIEAMSKGTADQLYLALRLAALDLRRESHGDMPLILDDALITSDDDRAAKAFIALEKFSRRGQVMLFTHHQHLIDVARDAVGENAIVIHAL